MPYWPTPWPQQKRSRYNQVVRLLRTGLAALLPLMGLLLSGCAKNIDTMDAVKQGVIKGIPKDINMGAMDVNVVSVSFRGAEADAVVSFAAKGGPPMMTMNYTLERSGDEWKIKKRAAGDLQKHAGPVPVPGAEAPAQASPAPGGMDLPPGHPGMDAPSTPAGPVKGGALPPGHPTTGAAK